jgi:hypothetical protein
MEPIRKTSVCPVPKAQVCDPTYRPTYLPTHLPTVPQPSYLPTYLPS